NMNGPVHPYQSELGNCWLWIGSVDNDGKYGTFRTGSKLVKAHRVALYLVQGKLSLNALHGCDVPLCCNANHLFEGSTLDNNRDRSNKGRDTKGSRNGNSKLTAAQVIEILAQAPSMSWNEKKKYAMSLSITVEMLQAILRKEFWKDVSKWPNH